jgi:hypothetical protein
MFRRPDDFISVPSVHQCDCGLTRFIEKRLAVDNQQELSIESRRLNPRCRKDLPTKPDSPKNVVMNYDTDKVDETVLALLSLTVHEENEFGARSWKGLDWAALDRLHKKGLIGNPVSKAKSVVLTPEGLTRSRELFDKLFAKHA